MKALFNFSASRPCPDFYYRVFLLFLAAHGLYLLVDLGLLFLGGGAIVLSDGLS